MIDGLTNTQSESGHLHFGRRVQEYDGHLALNWTFYEPVSREGRVETTEVLPYFLGLNPEDNPGRAGLEMMLLGDLAVRYCNAFATIRTDQSAPGDELSAMDVRISRSQFSRDGRTWLLSASRATDLERALAITRRKMPSLRISHFYTPAEGWFERITSDRRRKARLYFAGWCHGALLAAFITMGVELNQAEKTTLLPRTNVYHSRRLGEIRDAIRIARGRDLTPLFYVKDPAEAARSGASKYEAVDRASEICLHIIREQLMCGVSPLILIISDHNSEIGEDETRSGVTVVGVISDHDASIHLGPNRHQSELVDYLGLTS